MAAPLAYRLTAASTLQQAIASAMLSADRGHLHLFRGRNRQRLLAVCGHPNALIPSVLKQRPGSRQATSGLQRRGTLLGCQAILTPRRQDARLFCKDRVDPRPVVKLRTAGVTAWRLCLGTRFFEVGRHGTCDDVLYVGVERKRQYSAARRN